MQWNHCRGVGSGVGGDAGGPVGGASAVTQPGGPGRAAQQVRPARDANEPPGPSRGWAARGVTGREAGRRPARGSRPDGGVARAARAARAAGWRGGCGPGCERGPAGHGTRSPAEAAAESPRGSRDVSAPG